MASRALGSMARTRRAIGLIAAKLAARRRRCGAVSARPSGTAASGLGPRPRSGIASRCWSGRAANCAKPMRSCRRRRRILIWQRSISGRSNDRLHRRSSGVYWVWPICRILPIAPSTYHTHAARRAYSTQGSARAQRDAMLQAAVRRVHAKNSTSTACGRLGASSVARGRRWPAAR
jgi:hypothetical protein